jgi:hypothetical protein
MTEKMKCDSMCGRDAVMQIGKLNLCDECADEKLEGDGWAPQLRLEDVVDLDGPYGDELL